MRKFCLLLICSLLVAFSVSAQKNLISSRTTSYYTYIYKITDAEARLLYEKGMQKVKQSYFHTLVDTFRTDKHYTRSLPQGHFLFTNASGSDLEYELRTQAGFQVKLLENQRDLAIVVHDSLGRILSGAKVSVDKKTIPYDASTQTYRRTDYKQDGLLAVELSGFTYYQPLKRETLKPSFWHQVIYSKPLYYVWKPFQDIVKSITSHHPQGAVRRVFALFDKSYKRPKPEQHYKGYLVLNKPMYHPGDTVRYKAFVTNNKGKPYKEAATVYIMSDGKIKPIKQLKPYRTGGFEGSFVLHDSLKLTLDKHVSLALYSAEKEEKMLLMGGFRFEDYELKENTYTLKLEHKEHSAGMTNKVILKGVDANGLNLPDARIELLVLTQRVSRSPSSSLFIPDTLWRHNQVLEANGETTIVLPPSIFPNASLDYRVEGAFLNASNERTVQQDNGSYSHQKGRFRLTLKQDSLLAEYLEDEKSLPRKASIELEDKEDETFKTDIVQLPALIPLNPYAANYSLYPEPYNKQLSYQSDYLSLQDESDNLQLYTDRTPDSLFITLNNPRRLPFWYFIYRKDKLIDRGQGTDANWASARKLQGEEPYYVSFQYIWAGQVKQKELGSPFPKQELAINIQAPSVVYPGQQTTVTLEVKDAKGKPASDVDLTAYAITSKFKNSAPPAVPFFGLYKGRKALSKFQFPDFDDLELDDKTLLNWNQWHQQMGLDSIAYYHLLYPSQGIFSNYSSAPDSLTQFAPFVVDSGRVVPAHLIYVDEVPVYFSGNQVNAPYSFPADSGYHKLKLRTAKHLITLDSIYLKHGQKLTLSIDQNKMLRLLTQAEEGKLSKDEKSNLANYLFYVEKNFNGGTTYLQQGKRVQLLSSGYTRYIPSYPNRIKYTSVLVGPFTPDTMRFQQLGYFSTVFIPEPDFAFRFEPGLLKMRERETFSSSFKLPSSVALKLDKALLAQVPLTENQLRKDWEKREEEYWLNRIYTYNWYGSDKGTGRLHWELDSTFQDIPSPKFVFLHKPKAAADSVKIFSGSTHSVNSLKSGNYQLTLVFPDHRQLTTLVKIQPYGVLRLTLSATQVKNSNAQSLALEKIVQQRVLAEKFKELEASKVKPATPAKKTTYNNGASKYSFQIKGKITDKATGDALPGVTVQVKGTSVGTATNLEGEYTLFAPKDGTLVISYIGYKPVKIKIKGANRINATLEGDARALDEVVVVGYASAQKSDLSASVVTVESALNGRVAGVVVGHPGNSASIRIRGNSSISNNTQPLIIIDGVPFSGQMSDVSTTDIASMSTLKGSEASSIYGSAGANGVIIITTKKGKAAAQQVALQGPEADATASIRDYFSDYAFWQPRLSTDKQGKVTFPVTFPGDVTSWSTHVLGIDNHKRSGQASTEIRSFKAIMATLSGPRFLIEGDKTQLVGKAVNYLPDTTAVQTKLEFNGKTLRQQQLRLGRIFSDTVSITAPAVAPDSVELLFTLRQGNGFSDGERRHIGVYKKGVEQRTGQFFSLSTDTTFTLKFDPAKGPVHLYAQGNLLQVMLDEIQYLHNYEYWCNEQAASKLKGLLWEKRIRQQLNQPFEHERTVKKLVRHLEKTQKQDGGWSWWENGSTYYWISNHVVEALVMAQQEQYSTNFNKQTLTQQLVYQLEKKDAPDKIRALETLLQLQAKANYAAYIAQLEKQRHNSLEEQLRLTRLRQQLKMDAPLDTLEKYRQRTMLGGLYWGKEKASLFDNHISNTLLAYTILKEAGGHERDLADIRAYLLNERRTGHWRNTFESARILETLLPDLLKEKGSSVAETLTLSGGLNASFTRFPVDTTFTPTQPITVKKQGALPVYFTTYQNEWIQNPARIDKDFVVRTSFAELGTKANLSAGKPVDLQVEVDVKADASYVMLEVPIPAGCSYDTKTNWGPNEAHREYFRHKVAIFSNYLRKGKYTFTIKLLPRYKGTYTLNPARAELMYFPTFFGRESLKAINIK